MPRLHKSDLEDNIPLFIKERIPKAQINNVFDVGANVGWVTITHLNTFPRARVWSFEPVPSIFERLQENVPKHADISRVTLIQKAMGSTNGSARITAIPNVTVNKIVTQSKEPTVEIEVVRGDDFCRSQGIDHIDFLKVDAEGHDMQVLVGFGELLARGEIDFVQVEAGIAYDNTVHIPLRYYEGLLSGLGYRILTIKNQASTNIPYLGWADVVFVRDVVAKACA